METLTLANSFCDINGENMANIRSKNDGSLYTCIPFILAGIPRCKYTQYQCNNISQMHGFL